MQTQDSLSALPIRRPVLMIVMSLLIIIAGAAAFFQVEIRELPDVDRPQITVRANYDGASPETMDTEVTSVLEGAVAQVQGVKTIRSSSEENNCRIRIELQVGSDINDVANDLREAVSRARRQLPENVENLLVIKANDDAQAIVQLAAVSEQLTREELAKQVEKDVIPALMTIPNIAEVRLNGNQQRVLRILADPNRMNGHDVTIAEIASVLREARLDVPAGSLESVEQEFLVRADATVTNPDKILKLHLRDDLRLEDVATAFFGPDDIESYARLDGGLVIGMDIVRQAGGNTIAISEAVDQALQNLNNRFTDFEILKTSDDAVFIMGAIREVLSSLMIAILVVILIIALFIGQFKATLIPAVTIPVALIGTFAAIWLLGLSMNLLTLLAMVLATGLIVDDAIVVLENIQRHRKQGAGPLAAAAAGTSQVFFAVIATTITLVSVFLPIAFLPSETGQLFREFGLVLAVSVGISSFVALTLCPMLTTHLPADSKRPGWLRQLLLDAGAEIHGLYARSLTICLRYRYAVVFICTLLAGGSYLILQKIPQRLLPPEDRGVIRILATGPDGSALPYSDAMAEKVEAVLKPYQEQGLIDTVFTTVGQWDKNRSLTVVTLVPWDNREISQQQLENAIQQETSKLAGAQIRTWSSNSLGVRGARGGGIDFALTGDNYTEIYAAAQKFSSAIEQNIGQASNTRIEFDTSQPQLSFTIDREKAADLQVPVEAISQTLRAMVDGYEVSEYNIEDEGVPVMLGSIQGSIRDPQDLLNLYVPNRNGELVSMIAFVDIVESGVAAELDRLGQRRSIEMSIGLKPGAILADITTQIQSLAQETLPPGVHILFDGDASDLQESSRDAMITFTLALLIVFLVLAAQFESLGSAVIVIFTVPFGLAAALYALYATGQSVNLYSQIGLIMLVGLITKNAILLVEFMDQLRERGMPVEEAVKKGVEVRFRPVMMTVLSTVIGSLPLILATGPGSEARAAIGWVVFGGLGMATLFTLYLTPIGYALMAPFVKPRSQSGAQLQKEMQNYDIGEEADEF